MGFHEEQMHNTTNGWSNYDVSQIKQTSIISLSRKSSGLVCCVSGFHFQVYKYIHSVIAFVGDALGDQGLASI